MPTKKITKGVISAQTGEGQQVAQMALTKTASVVIEGETLTNRQYLSTGRAPWNRKTGYTPTVRINGVVSGCVVSGDAVTNNVQLTAGVANVNGVVVTVSADTTNTLTRPANAKKNVNALCVDNAGTVSVVVGSDGDSHDLTGGYGGAGQKPLVATTLAVLAYIALSEDEAAVVPAGDIYPGENANVEYIVDSLRGGIILYSALELNHTGPVSRGVYASFYDLTSALQPVGYIEEANLVIKSAAPVATPNHNSIWDQYVSLPNRGWTADIKRWRQDQYWADKILDPNSDEFYLKFQEDSADAFAWYGFGILNGDYSISIKRGPVSETLKFMGNGELRRV